MRTSPTSSTRINGMIHVSHTPFAKIPPHLHGNKRYFVGVVRVAARKFPKFETAAATAVAVTAKFLLKLRTIIIICNANTQCRMHTLFRAQAGKTSQRRARRSQSLFKIFFFLFYCCCCLLLSHSSFISFMRTANSKQNTQRHSVLFRPKKKKTNIRKKRMNV